MVLRMWGHGYEIFCPGFSIDAAQEESLAEAHALVAVLLKEAPGVVQEKAFEGNPGVSYGVSMAGLHSQQWAHRKRLYQLSSVKSERCRPCVEG